MENHFIGSERWCFTREFLLRTVKWGRTSNLEIEERGDWDGEEEMEEEEEYFEDEYHEECCREPYTILASVPRRECVNF
jgi:hypothetical protein